MTDNRVRIYFTFSSRTIYLIKYFSHTRYTFKIDMYIDVMDIYVLYAAIYGNDDYIEFVHTFSWGGNLVVY